MIMDYRTLVICFNIVTLSLQSQQNIEAFTLDESTSPNEERDDRIFDAIIKVSTQLETFNLHYLTKLEDKFVNIMQSLQTLDANMKQLQEKAQVWDVFRHHINSWSEHIKSTDNKIEILKISLENLPIIENQLRNTDFKVQHVFEKTDVINEKLHELTKSMLESRRAGSKSKIKDKDNKAGRSWSQEDFEQTEILMRLSKIQRVLQNTCSSIRIGKEIEGFKASSKTSPSSSGETIDDESTSLKTLMTKVNSNLEKIPIKELRQSLNLSKKHEKALETLTSAMNLVDERTIRIFDTNSYQFKKLLSCCKSTENEVLTFTNSANTLLKRSEKAIKAVEASTVLSNSEDKAQLNETDGSASGEIDEEMLDEAEYILPKKTNCFQLTTGRSGVYTFGTERVLNENGKDFYQQYCEYSTEGTAWTVIQKRDNFNPPENFNRSWNDYKHGFGNLSKDFWFGNDFIYKLTHDQNMVLRIVLEDFKDNHVWVEYGIFKIESEKKKFELVVDKYRGSIADSFLYHNMQPFSTFDKPNEKTNSSCAQSLGAGWWFKSCAESNLNGVWREEPLGNEYQGIFWEHWLGDYSLKASKMMVRPADVWFNNPQDEDLSDLGNELGEN